MDLVIHNNNNDNTNNDTTTTTTTTNDNSNNNHNIWKRATLSNSATGLEAEAVVAGLAHEARHHEAPLPARLPEREY